MLETVASFETPVEAQIVCALLHSAGIQAEVADLNLVSMNWTMSLAVGGVKVQVAPEDAEEAGRLVAAYRAGELVPDEAPEEEDRCGVCGSSDLDSFVPASQKALALAVFALAGAPICTRSRRVCRSCGAVETAD
jgi:hypothetical protein